MELGMVVSWVVVDVEERIEGTFAEKKPCIM